MISCNIKDTLTPDKSVKALALILEEISKIKFNEIDEPTDTFDYAAYSSKMTTFSLSGFSFSPGFVGGSAPFPTSVTSVNYTGIGVIAGIKVIFYNILTGEKVCEVGDYNDSSAENKADGITKEVLYNIRESVKDIHLF